MKNIGVFFQSPKSMDYPLNKEEYWISYQELAKEITNLGHNFFILRDQKTYMGNGEFSKSWQFENKKLIETGKIKIDTIYDKATDGIGFINDKKVKVINCEFINEICTNKMKTYEAFQKFCPKTILVNSEEEFSRACHNDNAMEISKFTDKKIVIKPIDGEEGNGVFIGDIEYLKKCPRSYPLLIQEFLDTSYGIPNIMEGIHDFRVILANGEPILSFYRTPPPGEFLANVARGGQFQIIEINKIPREIFPILKEIDELFKNCGDRIYAIDFAFTSSGAKIIELNSRFGLLQNSHHKNCKMVKQALAKLLVA